MAQPPLAHAVFPKPNHDELARQNFAQALTGYLLADVFPGNKVIYEKEVLPAIEKELRRPPKDRHEIRQAMSKHPYYQMWSALRRTRQELFQESVEATVTRQNDRLVERAQEVTSGETLGTLTLDPELEIPWYHTGVDIHLMPGGYHTERRDDDVFAGAQSDLGTYVYTAGQLGPLTDNYGRSVIENYLKREFPSFSPQRILDLGCTVGHSTLPYVDAYPDAEVHAIDVAAPLLRYAHARAESLGQRVHFAQENAEHTSFPDGSFDLIVSHILLHETADSAARKILRECHRLLAPGGIMAHLDALPQYRDMDDFQEFVADWDTWYNQEPFFGRVHELDFTELLVSVGFDKDELVETTVETTRVREGNEGAKGRFFLVGAIKGGPDAVGRAKGARETVGAR